MNQYLLTVLIKKDLEDKARKEILDGVKKSLGKVKEDDWGVRDLAYPIQHQQSAYYVHFEFESDPKEIKELDKSLKLNEDIIRYLLLRK